MGAKTSTVKMSVERLDIPCLRLVRLHFVLYLCRGNNHTFAGITVNTSLEHHFFIVYKKNRSVLEVNLGWRNAPTKSRHLHASIINWTWLLTVQIHLKALNHPQGHFE